MEDVVHFLHHPRPIGIQGTFVCSFLSIYFYFINWIKNVKKEVIIKNLIGV